MQLKKIICSLCAAALLVSLSACNKGGGKDAETTGTSDWRNTIEYEGNFYVNKGKKLLYALDKGTITLWDNAGDGKKLQTLEYDSTEAGAIESIEIKDMNYDGNADITAVFSEEEGNCRYNLWLWNEENGNYTYCKIFRTIPNPVFSEDGTTVTGTYNSGFFGNLEVVYAIDENLALTNVSSTVINSAEVAAELARQLEGNESVQLTEGFADVQDITCNVYAIMDGDKQTSYLAFSGEGDWYYDKGTVGAYRILTENDGVVKTGEYTDMTGSAVSICAELYKYDTSLLTVDRITEGKLVTVPVNEEGVATPYTDDEDIGYAYDNALEAKCYEISYNGEKLCSLARGENTTVYVLDPNLTGDEYYRLVSAAGEAQIVPDKAMLYDEN
ncbi:MAG: hypothetical protein IJ499_05720 [Clostridia bacterium]|nr:hypothetical protein [Clostridia bacterium]